MSEPRLLPVPDGLAGERLDVALTRLLGLSRSRSADLIASGAVLVDGAPGAKSDRLLPGSLLTVDLREPEEAAPAAPEPVPGMRVLLDDDDVVVVDKPVGVAAHPSPGWTGPTVVGGLAAAGFRISTSGAAERQGIVHRLDVGTSGVMVIAKSERAYTSLKRQFKERSVDKLYHAVVQGHCDPLSGTIDAPIDRHPQHDYRWAVVSSGKSSVTHYDTLEAFPHASLLEIHLETGRTHQIRVHMSALHHPCVGDLTYGADPVLAKRVGLTRQWLHAVRLCFDHPASGERICLQSAYPEDLQTALDRLRAGV
ncbi:MAG: RluA family pseudouridine synthase [Actinomycetales bacterium]|nr:RluA family pseudouridine synthase [Actinomycetales bacterium]